MPRLHHIVIGTALAAALALSGCSGDDASDAADDLVPAEESTTSTAPDAPPETNSTEAELPAGSSGSNRLDPVAVGVDSDLGIGLVASVLRVEPVEIEAAGPRETAGAGLLVEVELTNASEDVVDLTPITVNATGPDGEVAVPATGTASQPAHGELEPGAAQSAVYLFRLDGDRTGAVVEVQHGGAKNVVVVA